MDWVFWILGVTIALSVYCAVFLSRGNAEFARLSKSGKVMEGDMVYRSRISTTGSPDSCKLTFTDETGRNYSVEPVITFSDLSAKAYTGPVRLYVDPKDPRLMAAEAPIGKFILQLD